MPQPERTSSARRAAHLRVRVSVHEAEAIDARARQAGMRFSEYARHILICGQVVTRERVRMPFRLRIQLQRIAVNLAQLRKLEGEDIVHAYLARLHERMADILMTEIRALAVEEGLETAERDARGAPLSLVRAVRLSADQREVIEGLAHQAGLSLSDYARAMLAEGRVILFRDRQTDFPYLDELKAHGARINEAAHEANIHKRLPGALPWLLARLEPHLDLIAAQ